MSTKYHQSPFVTSGRLHSGQTTGMQQQRWTISPQERASHEQIFYSLRPISGRITGAQAKSYLMKSNLPPMTLAHVWSLSDMDGDGQMTCHEFSVAMHLIQLRLQGVDLPQTLPPSLRASSSVGVAPQQQLMGSQRTVMSGGMNFSVSHPGMPVYNAGSSATLPNPRKQSALGVGEKSLSGSSGVKRTESFQVQKKKPEIQQTEDNVPWAVQTSAKKRYNQMFNAHDRLRSGFLTGSQARSIFLQSSLSQPQLAQIWSLADIDGDGRLSNEEFAVAMHLVDEVHAGRQLPTSLPTSLIPPSMRKKRSLQQQAPSAIAADKPIAVLEKKSSFPVHTQSFEDKKRANFERGQLELEKRRQERREREQKEKEEKERKKREALEKRERELQEAEERRREAEERRAAELELERQKEMNKMRLEEDELQRVYEQKESAQREMEHAREREWQKRRKQELESQKSKVTELVTSLKQRTRLVNVEMQTLSQKYEGMLTTMKTNQSQIEETNLLLSRLSLSRDTRTAELERLHSNLATATQRLNFLSEARERLTQERKSKDHSPGAMLYQSVMDQCRDKMAAISRLRSEQRQQQEKMAEKTRERNAHQAQLMELSHSCESLIVDVKRLQHEMNTRKKERELQQQRQAEQLRIREEETRRQRDEMERMRKAAEETRKQQEEEQRRKEDEARLKRDQQLATMRREQEDKKMREQQKLKEAEEARKRVLDSSREAADSKQLSKAKRDADHQMKLIEAAARKRAELDDDAERRSQELLEREQKKQNVQKEVEQLHKQRAQLLELKKKQEQEAARQAAEEVKRKEERQLQQAAEEAERQQEIRQREEAQQQQKAAEEAKRKLKAVKERRLAEEAEKKKREQADAKRREIEAKKQALIAKKTRLLEERTTAGQLAAAVVRYRAEFDFAGRSDHELSFKSGDILTVKGTSQEVEDGWLMGELNGQNGLFPKNYCIRLEATPSPQLQRRSGNSKSRSPTPPQGPSIPVAKPRHTVRNPSPLSTSSGDDVPAVSALQRCETSPAGLTPSIVTQQHHSAPCSPTRQLSPVEGDGEDRKTETSGSSRLTASLSADSFKVVALYPWRAQKDDHLSFGKDDIIAVHDQNEMWYNGELGGKTGWFPKSYVKQITVRKTVSASVLQGTRSSNSSAEKMSTFPEANAEPMEKGLSRPQEYVALYNYSGSVGDLSFKAGDVIEVIQMTGEWWTGTLGDKKGIFPANYVKKKKQPTVKDMGPVSHPRSVSSPVTDGGKSIVKRPLLASVVASYEAQGPEQLSLQPGQLIHVKKQNANGWWEGELQARGKKRKIGWFPSNRVKLMGNPFQTAVATRASTIRRGSKDDSSQSSSSSLQNSPKGDNHVLAIYSYTAASEDELTFNKGSVITVLSKESEWWKGELNGVVGVFPSNYVQPLSELQPPSSQQWSDTVSPVILQGLGDNERMRQEAIFELVQTEQSYVDSLNLVVEIFMEPMEANHILEQDELDAVFVNWKELIASNYKLLKALNVRLKVHEGEPIPMIGDILCEMLPRLTAYIRFCSRQLNACNVLQSKNSPALREFETVCAQDSRTGGLRLSSFLLKPMQRVTKYPPLVQKILKYTPIDHVDHEPLAAAQKKSEELCSQVNEGVRMQENSDRLEWFQTHINTAGLSEELIFNSSTNCMGPRKLLKSGTLRKARSGRELFALLFNDFLMLTQAAARNPITAIFDSSSTSRYDIYRKPLFVDELLVQPASSGQYTDECHFYLSGGDEKPLILKADSPSERNSWIQKITTASQSYKDKQKHINQQEELLRNSRGQGIGQLIVTVVEATNLPVGDITGKSDPYCVVGLGVQTQKTPVIEKTLNPKWNKTMDFIVRDANQDRLSITIFDRDFFSPSDFLGRAEVLLSDLLKDGKGPWNKWYVLQEVTTGEVHVRLELKFHRGATTTL